MMPTLYCEAWLGLEGNERAIELRYCTIVNQFFKGGRDTPQ
ncbi:MULTISPECIES: hypothetical protein [Microcoleaceae]|nr:hypothetical protein [Lyngbya sp. CCAP 1446/10]